jgi:hypothetical protein
MEEIVHHHRLRVAEMIIGMMIEMMIEMMILLLHHQYVSMEQHKEVRSVILVGPKLHKNVSMENEQML